MDESHQRSKPLIPRLTYPYLESLIVMEDYHHFPGSGTTVCYIKVENGFSCIADSTCGSAERFDFEIGKNVSRRKALKKLMEHEQYLLRQRLHEAQQLRQEDD